MEADEVEGLLGVRTVTKDWSSRSFADFAQEIRRAKISVQAKTKKEFRYYWDQYTHGHATFDTAWHERLVTITIHNHSSEGHISHMRTCTG